MKRTDFELQIQITDANDNPPVMTILTRHTIIVDDEIVLDIHEEIPTRSKVFAVSASDVDQDENGRVCFKLDDLTENLVSLESNCTGHYLRDCVEIFR